MCYMIVLLCDYTVCTCCIADTGWEQYSTGWNIDRFVWSHVAMEICSWSELLSCKIYTKCRKFVVLSG